MAKPTRVWKFGDVECALFEQPVEGKNYARKSFKFQKSYKDKEGNWKQTDFFGVQDIGSIALLSQKVAIEVIAYEKKQKIAEEPKEEYGKGGFYE
ncbi:MAG: hypothetical protein HGB12_00135 [Bacteroidetes bacterium]|nr:hypothetical protein [Bacteroidota bacterium]